MTQMDTDKGYNPDVLTCIANLSSDEVFTPPRIQTIGLQSANICAICG